LNKHEIRAGAESDRGGLTGEDVTAADAPLRSHEPCAFQGQQDLLEIGLRQTGALGDVADGRRPVAVTVKGERHQRTARIVTSRRHLHGRNDRDQRHPASGRMVAITPRELRHMPPDRLW
jgi:hypothetical protein